MKNKLILLLLGVGVFFTACRKKTTEEEVKIGGCTDIDSPGYKKGMDYDDGSCKYAFVTEVEVLNFPAKKNGSSWDDFGGKPDIYFKLKPVIEANYDNYFNSIGNKKNNASPDDEIIWVADNQFKLTNSDWYWELLDDDDFFGGADDQIASGIFNPISRVNTSDNTVLITSVNGETQIKLTYILQ